MVIRADGFWAQAEALPSRSLDEILAPGGVLVLAPHPDDESLGCGGLIAAAVAAARRVRVVFISDGAASHPAHRAVGLPARRETEARQALRRLGVADGAVFLGLPDSRVPGAGPAFAEAVARIAAEATAIDAGTVLATWAHDPHGDHQACAAMQAALPPGRRHLAYAVWGHALPPETPLPGPPRGAWLDIAPWLPAKTQAIQAHRSQLGDLPEGFALDAAMLARAARPAELYLEAQASPSR
ncbi:PIG-L deacetylase family protein [Roseomonas sp. 18066]|uniref:PIG-L deacetylase family protein n=1 Tax=Roseomonas sp. 18066 TaxID=2681412 RepID=UPI001F21C6B5|nr:PIG-L deacetylase family protein [Roseomonas sp. 18066]